MERSGLERNFSFEDEMFANLFFLILPQKKHEIFLFSKFLKVESILKIKIKRKYYFSKYFPS